MDENAISVLCEISGCFARVIGDVRCREHGGAPVYGWTDSEFGDVRWVAPDTEEIEPYPKEGRSEATTA